MKLAPFLLVGLLTLPVIALAESSSDYHIAGKITIGGTGHWDYIVADPPAHRLYLSHNDRVEVVDSEAKKVVGSIKLSGFSHGIAIADRAGHGFITVGESPLETTPPAHEVAEFDLKTLKVVKTTSVPKDPDGILYDPASGDVFAFGGDSHVATVFDGKSGAVVKSIKLEGSPEASVADGKGNIYVNVSDKNTIAQIDTTSMSVVKSFDLTGCDGPAGLAMNVDSGRLFSACDNKVLDVVEISSGKVITTVNVAPRNDGVAYDPQRHTIFVSTLMGALSIIKESGDTYALEQTLQTPAGSRTLALDPTTHALYLSSSKFLDKKPGQKYPDPVPGTFGALIVAR